MRKNLVSVLLGALIGVSALSPSAEGAPHFGLFGRGGGFGAFMRRPPFPMRGFGSRGPWLHPPSPFMSYGAGPRQATPRGPYPEGFPPRRIGSPIHAWPRPQYGSPQSDDLAPPIAYHIRPQSPPPWRVERREPTVIRHDVARTRTTSAEPPPPIVQDARSQRRHAARASMASVEPPRRQTTHEPRAHDKPTRVALAAERRYVPGEVLVRFRDDATFEAIEAFAREQSLDRISVERFDLIGASYYRYRLRDRRAVEAAVTALQSQALVAAIQPNYKYALEDAPGGSKGFAAAQYAVPKLSLNEAHRRALGLGELVAVIDSGVDARHPELDGSVAEEYDELAGNGGADPHGTSIAGLIGAHAELVGVAPRAQILSIRAFASSKSDPGAQGSSVHIARAIQWAYLRHARLVNMSFAGPSDPLVGEIVRAGHRENMIFVAAAGNDGPRAAPAYPAAYPEVIAVTATDARDRLYAAANVGDYVSVAAPGVDLLVAEPGNAYQFRSGTSLAAAEVTGVIALMLEINPGLDAAAVRLLLSGTARPAPRGSSGAPDAARIDALAAVIAADTFFLDSAGAREESPTGAQPPEASWIKSAAAR